MRVGDLHVTVRAKLDAVLGPGDVRCRVATHVARQRDVGTDGERVAVVQDDVGRDGNCGGTMQLGQMYVRIKFARISQ